MCVAAGAQGDSENNGTDTDNNQRDRTGQTTVGTREGNLLVKRTWRNRLFADSREAILLSVCVCVCVYSTRVVVVRKRAEELERTLRLLSY